MDIIFKNTENSKTSDPLLDKIKLKGSDKYIPFSNLTIYFTWKNIKKSYKNNKFKVSTTTWNEEFESRDGSYSVSDIQDNFKYIFKKHETVTNNLLIII